MKIAGNSSLLSGCVLFLWYFPGFTGMVDRYDVFRVAMVELSCNQIVIAESVCGCGKPILGVLITTTYTILCGVVLKGGH